MSSFRIIVLCQFPLQNFKTKIKKKIEKKMENVPLLQASKRKKSVRFLVVYIRLLQND